MALLPLFLGMSFLVGSCQTSQIPTVIIETELVGVDIDADVRRCAPPVPSPSMKGITQKDVAVLIRKMDHRANNCAANLAVVDGVLKSHNEKIIEFNQAERKRVSAEIANQ